ncbi:MAG: hypothetical protein V4654_10045 [Bdellovibrionota bacterium]
MKHKTWISYLVLAVAMTGCLKVQKKDEVVAKAASKNKPPVVQPKQVLSRELRLDDVFIESVGLNQPNIYDLVFSWPQTKDRLRLTANNQALTVVDTKDTQQWTMSHLQGGASFSLLIEILDSEGHVITSEARQIEMPKDYVFPKSLRLTSDMSIQSHRVFMSDSLITTENFNLEIRANQLIVLNKSYIQSYASEAKAKIGSAGRSAGFIRIEANSAEGDLDITMNSEAGGDGLKGFESPPCGINSSIGCMIGQIHCPQGSLGYPSGNNGNLFVRVKDITNFRLYSQEQLSLGGRKGPSMSEDTPIDYPVVTSQFIGSGGYTCAPRHGAPARGADAIPGRVCLVFSGSVPEPGCE